MGQFQLFLHLHFKLKNLNEILYIFFMKMSDTVDLSIKLYVYLNLDMIKFQY